jgi:hypothetical protein
MGYSTGKLLFIFVVAVVLSALGAWIIAARYRATMLALMSGSAGAGAATDAAAAPGTAAQRFVNRPADIAARFA